MTDTTTDTALTRHRENGLSRSNNSATNFVAHAPQFWSMAEGLAGSDIIPKGFQGKPANVFVALEMAHRLGIGPMEAMQNLYVVHGTPSLSAKFLIGLANRSDRFKGGLRFREVGEGADLAVTCYATDKETGEDLSLTVTMEQAKEAGWTKNQKYREIPHQMLSYRAATFFVRRYCPEVMLGMPTVDEAEEMPPREAESSVVQELQAQIDAELEAKPAPRQAEPEPDYAPEVAVAKLVAAFEAVGVRDTVLAAEFGPLDKLTAERFKAAQEYGKRIKGGRKPEEVFQREDALALLDAGASPDGDMFATDGGDEKYDPADLGEM